MSQPPAPLGEITATLQEPLRAIQRGARTVAYPASGMTPPTAETLTGIRGSSNQALSRQVPMGQIGEIAGQHEHRDVCL
jgi:hypothetical protein